MRHIIFEESVSGAYPVALLCKNTSFSKKELTRSYVDPLVDLGLSKDLVIAFTLEYNEHGKAPNGYIKEYLAKLLPALDSLCVKTLYVADAAYFKVLTSKTKAEPHMGYPLPCTVKGFEHMTVILGINYQALIYSPDLQAKLDMSLKTLIDHLSGSHQALGTGIIHSEAYPDSDKTISEALQKLHQYPSLTCDIEGFSLKFNEAGIGTIAFAWDKNNGIAFACDYMSYWNKDEPNVFGMYVPNRPVRSLLLEFFSSYKGELTFHGSTYDVKAIIYTLWMQSLLDTQGMLEGLDTMTARMHDTKIIAYLATNSTAGNVLGLKPLAHEFAGNWAVEDIKNIKLIPLEKLLRYNLVDALSTHYVRDKYEPIMEKDQQGDLYRGLMLDSLKLIIQLELTGMPMSRTKIAEIKAKLEIIRLKQLGTINSSPVIQTMNLIVRTKAMVDANAKLKTKQHPLEKFENVDFNPNSGAQLQVLLYQQMGLPVLDYTDTKMPATGFKTLKKLVNHTQEPASIELLEALIAHGQVIKILDTFIPAFEEAISKDSTDTVWLHGCFNLGGTVSGRLSSSDPNLQNLPANSTYGKLIKEAFVAPKDWLFCGADFNSLEDYISALTTRDPNKLDVYLRGFDGHCLRAAFYYEDVLTMIDKTDPKSVNSIKYSHPELRQDSKTPTFLLTYGGTHHGMMAQLGWNKEKSVKVEVKYHEMYKVSDEYIQTRLHQASKDGFVTVAFGLRVRTPLLSQVIFNGPKMPYEAAAEGRTAGNAMGQSYGLLNNRAAVEFMQKVWKSKHRFDILPIALIHDAIYILVKDNVETVRWANCELIKSMQWQELPEIQHPTVKLGAAMDIFWPSWANATTLPNDADIDTIFSICQETKINVFNKQKETVCS